MTNQEFSNQFDTLLNSFNTEGSIILDEYEKSVFLTKAQEEVFLEIYTGKNQSGDVFEKTEETKRYFSNLTESTSIDPITDLEEYKPLLNSSSFIVKLPDNLWFIIHESVDYIDDALICNTSKTGVSVVPITHDEYHKVKNNPFRGANGRRVLRVDRANNSIELISKFDIKKYYVRYIKRLTPIILEDLPDNLSIGYLNSTEDGNKAIECSLHPSLHNKILDRAVRLALISKNIRVAQ